MVVTTSNLTLNMIKRLENMRKAKTISDLKTQGYKSISVKEEMRNNLIAKIRNKEPLFAGIIGYEETVIPQIQNAVLSGQDIVLLGERGQAKSRLIRALIELLDEEIPFIKGCEINDDPFNPTCSSCKDLVKKHKGLTPIEWMNRQERYGEKLATPDITVADLIGEVDPIKVAEGRYLSDDYTIHYGLIPRSNRGIFCINELPDLSERIQVGMFNILEERDVQIKGYKVNLPLDLCLIASANPEDYTNRGRIITPLKDRFGAQIKTHYPQTIEHEIQVMEQEVPKMKGTGININIPMYIKEIIAEFTHLARKSGDINQRSGVSVRVSIGNYQTIIANSVRRSLLSGETEASPRISDMTYMNTSTLGKIELESIEDGRESKIVEEIAKRAVLNTFNHYFNLNEFDALIGRFNEGLTIDTGDMMPSKTIADWLKDVSDLKSAQKKLKVGRKISAQASAIEFILEGLHLSRRINKDFSSNTVRYRG